MCDSHCDFKRKLETFVKFVIAQNVKLFKDYRNV